MILTRHVERSAVFAALKIRVKAIRSDGRCHPVTANSLARCIAVACSGYPLELGWVNERDDACESTDKDRPVRVATGLANPSF